MKSSVLFWILLLAAMVSRGQSVPDPKEYFGFNIGDDYMLANYTQTLGYVKKIAELSGRVKFVEIGKTEEGRSQFMLIITSPENQQMLARYKDISCRLARAEGLTDEQARALAAEGKAVVWIDGGLHATELVATQQLIETIYQLCSRKDPETLRILDKVVILCANANPDGQDIVSDAYMSNKVPEKRTVYPYPRLYEKYAGHDNNRDFFMNNLRESQNISRQLYIEWLPQIVYNHHQSGPFGTVVAGPPCRDPFNYVFDPIVMTSLDALGAAMSNRLNVEGKPGYTERTGASFSTWWNGGLRTTPYFHNMIGILTEIIGSPEPSEVPLELDRILANGSMTFPVLPQKWHFRQSIDYSVSLNYAVLGYAARNRDELLYNIYRMGKNSIERGSRDNWSFSPRQMDIIESGTTPPRDRQNDWRFKDSVIHKHLDSVLHHASMREARGFIVPSDQPDFPTAIKFINALIWSGIRVERATASFSVGGKTYPAGSYVVKTDQAFRPHVLDMFEPQYYPNDFKYPGGPPIPPYDMAGWTLAFSMGVRFDRVLDRFDGPFVRVPYGELQSVRVTNVVAAGAGYILDARSNNSFVAVNELLRQGVTVYRVLDTVARGDVSAGSFFVPGSSRTKVPVARIADENGVRLIAAAKRPLVVKEIKPARVALLDDETGDIPSGWVRFILERYHFPFDMIHIKDIDTLALRQKYDVLLVISQEAGLLQNDASTTKVRKFLSEGGDIVAVGATGDLVYRLGAPVRDKLVEMVDGQEQKLPDEKFYIPGGIVRVRVDPGNAAAWGMDSVADVSFLASPVFDISPEGWMKGTIRPIAWFADDKPLRSGWALGQSDLKDGIAAFVTSIGQGKLYAFGPDITWRAQTYGVFKMLFNELYKTAW